MNRKRWNNKKYESWVRTLPCCVCGSSETVCHHIIGTGGMSGMGMKAPSYATMALCTPCHQKMHTFPDMWGDQWRYVVETLGKAIEEGILK